MRVSLIQFTNEPVLIILDLDEKKRIKVNAKDFIYGVWEWIMETCSIPLKISQWDKEKLWDSWQEDVDSNKRIEKLKTLVRRYQVQFWGLDRL